MEKENKAVPIVIPKYEYPTGLKMLSDGSNSGFALLQDMKGNIYAIQCKNATSEVHLVKLGIVK